MAWIILWANGDELTRLDLSRAVVIGRSTECDLPVRDLMMSRVHCRIEPLGRGWRIVDLGSKNGTRVGWQRVQAHVLRDGDWLRIGRTRITFYTGPFQPGALKSKPAGDRLVRPADPHEALSGTVTDFVLLDDDENPDLPTEESFAFPSPQPRPLEPVSYSEPAVETLLDALASNAAELGHSSHATGGTATLARPRLRARPLPRIVKKPVYREVGQAQADDTDLALQADQQHLPAARSTAPPKPANRLWTALGIGMVTAVGTAIVLMSAWLLTLAP